jgi:hypothetical protein
MRKLKEISTELVIFSVKTPGPHHKKGTFCAILAKKPQIKKCCFCVALSKKHTKKQKNS